MTAQLKPITGMRESVEDLNGEITEYIYVTPDEETMRELTRLLFEEHWREIVVGEEIETGYQFPGGRSRNYSRRKGLGTMIDETQAPVRN
jgi:hypothetical protein